VAEQGQIYGFDINSQGDDGGLATATDVETFDQNTGKITKSFANKMPTLNSYLFDGIFAGDTGLVTRFVMLKNHIGAKRVFELMDPVSAEQFTGKWTPPIDVNVEQNAENQTTSTGVVLAIELANQDNPDLIVSNFAANTMLNLIHLDPNLFGLANGPQLAQDTTTNQAVIALSPDAGEVHGAAPINVLVDLATGKITQFQGLNLGEFGAGDVNGLAVDSTTGIAATTTELNAQVEFYTLAKKSGFAVQLPGTGPTSQLNSGAAVANDPINKLFLVADPVFGNGNQGSAVVVYDENGTLVESITGFNFSNASTVVPVRIALNPSKRMGWVNGPNINELQQFTY